MQILFYAVLKKQNVSLNRIIKNILTQTWMIQNVHNTKLKHVCMAQIINLQRRRATVRRSIVFMSDICNQGPSYHFGETTSFVV